MDLLHDLVNKHQQEVIDLRRYFHTYPEVSKKEFNTQKKIMEILTALGLNPKAIANTGVMAELEGAKPGKCIAIRADIDALELQDECGKPYQSVNHGVCHACGHDGHISMLLGVAKVLTDYREQLAGSIRFLFQPTEERFPGGALSMIEDGALDGVDAIIGAHLWQPVPVGTIGIKSGRFMASPDEFSIAIQGRGGHGSMPHQTVDALLTASQIAVALNTVISRSIDPLEQAVLSIGYLHSGDTFNIIPDSAILKGTVRSFEESIRQLIFKRIETITKGICEAAGATYTFDKVLGFPPVINEPICTDAVLSAVKESLGEDKIFAVNPSMGGEDFSYYLEKVPGAFMFVGVGNDAKGIIYPQHHPKYDIDEDALAYGTEVMARAAVHLARAK
jgi:amidohydrolase